MTAEFGGLSVLYFVYRVDKPGTPDLRMKIRPAHIEYAEDLGDTLYSAGPSFDDEGNMNGSVWIVEAGSRAEAEAITAADPYEKVDLFETKIVRRFERTAGTA
tara:strand:- start:292 stop:600 length:309 start_codon:yes stop_codon:yes gene_type:complete